MLLRRAYLKFFNSQKAICSQFNFFFKDVDQLENMYLKEIATFI